MFVQSFDLTQSQLRLLETVENASNRCVVFRILGELDEERLARAIELTLRASTPFQYRFLRSEGGFRILQSEHYIETLRTIHAHTDANIEDESLVFSLIDSLCSTSFRLDAGAPYQFTLTKGIDSYYLIFVCHPVVVDRFSLRPLFSSIAKFYNTSGKTSAPGSEETSLGLDQAELLRQESLYLSGPLAAENTQFWMKLVRDTNFEWRPPRMEGLTYAGPLTFSVDETIKNQLIDAAATHGMDLNRLLKLSFHIFLSKMTHNETIVTSYFHRIQTSQERPIGFNENKLALKSLIDAQVDLKTFFTLANRLCDRMEFHSNIPARTLTKELLRMDPDFKRVTNVLFDQDPLPYDEFALENLETRLQSASSFHLEGEDVAIHYRVDEEIRFRIYYRHVSEVEGLQVNFQSYLNFLRELTKKQNLKISEINLHSTETLLESFDLADGGDLLRPAMDPMNQFFQTVADHPDSPALKFRQITRSYGELAGTVRQISQSLRRLGPTEIKNSPGSLVAIAMGRSEVYVQSILGVMASGYAYLPLDPEMSPDRLKYILQDAKPSRIIVDDDSESSFREKFADIGIPLIQWKELAKGEVPAGGDEAAQVDLDALAYMIYTSGTTGRPKGVMVTRRNLATLMAALEGVWARGPGMVFSQFAAFTFDASVLSIFNPILHGACVAVVPTELRADPAALFEFMKTERVTHADLPPALMPLLPRDSLPDLVAVVCGGEAIEEEAVRFWSKVVDLCNCYGPTEATVMATMTRLGGYKSTNNLGRPLPGYRVYIMENPSHLSPLGAVGEIAIGGDAVALGYWGREDLTREKFRPDPKGSGRIYMTGDLGRFLPNGDLEFLGRSDFQVKIRGFRIELSEIESVISDQPEVHGTFTAAIENEGQKVIVTWYVGPRLKPATLRERLARFLPSYMVPSYLIPVPYLPVTSHGKVDRHQLLQLHPLQSTDSSQFPQDFDELQKRVRGEWARILKLPVEEISLGSHFFALGGHSLLVASLCARLGAQFQRNIRPRLLFEFPIFRDFCEKLRVFSDFEVPLRAIVKTNKSSLPVGSRMLNLMFTRTISNPDDNTYNIVSTIQLTGAIDVEALRQALGELFSAHAIFRYSFFEENGQLWLRENKRAQAFEISARSAEPNEIEKAALDLRKHVFGMVQAPLWKAEIFCGSQNQVTVLFGIHHSIFDGWSLNLFMQELELRYRNRLQNQPTKVEPLTWIDYFDATADLRQQPIYRKSLDYWRTKLSGGEARVELPFDRSKRMGNSNLAVPVDISPEVLGQLKTLAHQWEITLSPLLFSLYLIWLWRVSGQEDLTVGYPYAGRDWPGSQEIYGAFIVVGYLKARVKPQMDWSELAREVHRQMVNDKDFLFAAPYEAGIPGQDDMNIMFSLQTGIHLDGQFGSGSFFAEELPTLTSKGDLSAIFYENSKGGCAGRIEFDGSLFERASIETYLQSFYEILQFAAANPSRRISEIRYLPLHEVQQIQNWSTGPRMNFDEETLFERFYKISQKFSDREALFFKGKSTNYQTLRQKSFAIAEAFLSRHPEAQSETFIGFAFEKSDAALAGLLSILAMGKAYVPLDLSYPTDRLRFFCQNTALRFVVTDAKGHERMQELNLPEVQTFLVTEKMSTPGNSSSIRRQDPRSLAYVIHTSGSTGQPKGVLIENRSVVRMIESSARSFGYDESCLSSLVGPFGFDTSVLEIFLPLLCGGSLSIVPEEDRKDPRQVFRLIADRKLSHVVLPPALLQNFPLEPLPDLRFLGFGGDTIDEKTADFWSRHVPLYSCYGPTEITVQSSIGLIRPGENPHTLGRPLPGYSMYLLDSHRQLVVRGAVGEIYVGGEQAARGYLNLPQWTQERFVQDTVRGDLYSTMYRTGDLGRFLPDGQIAFLGRNDHQIKLRGYRIELGEIENRLLEIEGIQQAVVAPFGRGEGRYLAAYYTGTVEIAKEILRTALLKSLPEYMVPAFFVRLEKFPLNANGKIDRRALPEVSGQVAAHPPRPGLETQIAQIWESVLRFKGISRDESFFTIGGNSLLAIRMQSELREQLKIEFSMADFYGHPTIEALANRREIDYLSMALQDSQIEIATPAPAPERATFPPRRFLLTGGSGFLGIFLLQDLLNVAEKVYVLLRSPDLDSAREALSRSAQASGVSLDFAKIEIVLGDLSRPRLGMSDSTWQALAGEVDSVIHCGAFVHHLQNYSVMKSVNVSGTVEVIKLALERRMKSVCYVSTLSVGAALEGADHIREAVLDNRPLPVSGYILTKWVSEQILWKAHQKFKIPVCIARPANITGRRDTGYTNFEQNHFWLFNKGNLQLGEYPKLNARIEMMPVDVLSRAIVKWTMALGEGFSVANLYNPRTISQDELYRAAEKLGFKVHSSSIKDWQKRLEHLPEANALSSIQDFYKGDLEGPAMPVVDQEKTLQRLRELGVSIEVDLEPLLPIYFQYLVKAGFLKPL